MGYLGENAKNLACRLGKQGALDKKVERSFKLELMALERTPLDEWLQLVSVSPGNPSRDPSTIQECREMAMHAFNLKALQQLRFLGLTDPQVNTKEWAVRLMANQVDFGELKETSGQLVAHLFHPDMPVSKGDVCSLLKTLLGMNEG